MKYEKYAIEASDLFLKYKFQSNGLKGLITKQILYSEFAEHPDVYNLALGDVDKNGDFDDDVVTNNGDREKVLATVALTVMKFFEAYPEKWIFMTGSTEVRTRLYSIAITKNLNELESSLNLFGLRKKRETPYFRVFRKIRRRLKFPRI